MAGMVKPFQDAQAWKDGSQLNDSDLGSFADSYFQRDGGGNTIFTALSDLKLNGNPFNLTFPIAVPNADSPLANGAQWTNTKVATGFDKVTYIGAFATTESTTNNWTTTWCNFDPQNTVY
jgi:hypothetical protein